MNEQQTAVNNLALLHQHHPEVAKGLLRFLREQRQQHLSPRFQLITTPNQAYNVLDLRGAQQTALHDLTHPKEAARQQVQPIINNSPGVIFVFSTGLGYILQALTEALGKECTDQTPVPHKSKWVLIESEWELLFLGLKALDWQYALASRGTLLLGGGSAYEQALELIHRFGSLLKHGAEIIAGRMLNEHESSLFDQLKEGIQESKKNFQHNVTTPRSIAKRKAAFATASAHRELLPTLEHEAAALHLSSHGAYRPNAIKHFLHTEEMWWETVGLPLPQAVLTFSLAMFYPQEWFQMAKHGVQRLVWYYDDPFRHVLSQESINNADRLFGFDPELCQRMEQQFEVEVTYVPGATTFSAGVPLECGNGFIAPPEVCFIGSTGIQRIGEGYTPLVTQRHRSYTALQELAASCLRRGTPVPYDELLAADIPLSTKKPESRICLLEDLTTLAVRLYYLTALQDFPLALFGDEGWSMPEVAGGLTQHYQGRDLHYRRETPWVYQASAININIFNVQCINSPTVRVLDVMACGGFLLSEYRPFMDEMFRIGEELEVFRTPEELREKVQYYLAHPDERRQIARAGQKRVLAEHGYRHRFPTLFAELLSERG